MSRYTLHWSHRVDTARLWEECDDKRRELGMTWRQVAKAVGCRNAANFFPRLRRGDDIGVHSSSLVSLLVWLGRLDWEDPLVCEQPPVMDNPPVQE